MRNVLFGIGCTLLLAAPAFAATAPPAPAAPTTAPAHKKAHSKGITQAAETKTDADAKAAKGKHKAKAKKAEGAKAPEAAPAK